MGVKDATRYKSGASPSTGKRQGSSFFAARRFVGLFYARRNYVIDDAIFLQYPQTVCEKKTGNVWIRDSNHPLEGVEYENWNWRSAVWGKCRMNVVKHILLFTIARERFSSVCNVALYATPCQTLGWRLRMLRNSISSSSVANANRYTCSIVLCCFLHLNRWSVGESQ